MSSPDYNYATLLCNQLEKLNPPPFVTVQNLVNKSSTHQRSPALLLHKLSSSTKSLNQSSAYFTKEISLLSGFIERKGTQLRLEKALQLSSRILKLGLRWKLNDFDTQLNTFCHNGTELEKAAKRHQSWLPSRQWAQWIIYLCLRGAVLLVKIKLECEKTTKFWLGLISSSHHWGDSLVVTSILSRIWHLSKVIFSSIANDTYPKLHGLTQVLKPTEAPSWPTDKFNAPDDLSYWIHNSMHLSNESSTTDNATLERLSHPLVTDESELEQESHRPSKILLKERISDLQILATEDKLQSLNTIEDFGEVVKLTPVERNKKKFVSDKKKKFAPDKKKKFALDKKKKFAPVKKKFPSDKNVNDTWNILFKNHHKFTKTLEGRQKLFKNIKKSLAVQSDDKIKLKLRNIMRSIRSSNNDDYNKPSKLIKKFQEYVNR